MYDTDGIGAFRLSVAAIALLAAVLVGLGGCGSSDSDNGGDDNGSIADGGGEHARSDGGDTTHPHGDDVGMQHPHDDGGTDGLSADDGGDGDTSKETKCGDGKDNDGNGSTDCADPNCHDNRLNCGKVNKNHTGAVCKKTPKPRCAENSCTNGEDDDGDGLDDKSDPDCN